MELGLDFSPGRKAPPRRGRRAGVPNTNIGALHHSPERDDIGSTDDIMDSPTSNSALSSGFLNSPPKSLDSAGPVAPPRSRRTGGWADEAIKSGKRRSAVNLAEHVIRDNVQTLLDRSEFEPMERFLGPGNNKGDSDDDIPVIPDLDDMQDEDLASEIAHAPSSTVNRVDTYKELDSDLFKHATFANLDDISLRLLLKSLNLESEIKEADTAWTWDLLFTDVASELHYEWENKTQTNLDISTASP